MLKRKVCQNISNCFQCPLLETIDGFVTHCYHCPELDEYTNEVGDPTSQEMDEANTIMEDWFSRCPKWPQTNQEQGK